MTSLYVEYGPITRLNKLVQNSNIWLHQTSGEMASIRKCIQLFCIHMNVNIYIIPTDSIFILYINYKVTDQTEYVSVLDLKFMFLYKYRYSTVLSKWYSLVTNYERFARGHSNLWDDNITPQSTNTPKACKYVLLSDEIYLFHNIFI